jgi:hypothetical protein
MKEATMKSVDKVTADRDAALNDMRAVIDQAAREYERMTGQAVTRVEAYRKGADWQINVWTINAVRAVDGKVFV